MRRNHVRLALAALPARDISIRGWPPNGVPVTHPAKSGAGPLSRRHFLAKSAGAGLALGAGLLLPTRAFARHDVAPRPIPATIPDTPFHHEFPGPADQPGHEPSHITDFHGSVGVLDFEGTGHGTGYDDTLSYSGDLRFQTGTYIGVDGRQHRGTFAFV